VTPARVPRPAAGGDLAALCAEVARLATAAGEDAAEELASRLAHPSWYLRERVVDALARRAGGAAGIARVLREGAWWARASACDVVARRGEGPLDDVLAATLDPNVSLQKSAARALAALAARGGTARVAARVAALDAAHRRRVVARVGHQVPAWAPALEAELAALPAAPAEPAPQVAPPEEEEVRALVRFRAWLRGSRAAPAREARG
jgi:hypothetical protein